MISIASGPLELTKQQEYEAAFTRWTPRDQINPGTICLAYPHGIDVKQPFMDAVIRCLRYDGEHRGIIRDLSNAPGLYLALNRNNIVANFMAGKCEWLLQADADTAFDSDIPYKLLDAADPMLRPIIGPLCFSWIKVGDEGQRILLPQWYRKDDLGLPTPLNGVGANEYELLDVVMGSMIMVHRDVFEAVGPMWRHTGYPWFGHDLLSLHNGGKTIYDNNGIPVTLGEDVTFCYRARALGFYAWGFTGARIGHLKENIECLETFKTQVIAQQSKMARAGAAVEVADGWQVKSLTES